jgi:cysteine synthase A
MIRDAEKQGKLREGGTIIEATSGNTGIALAFIAAARGYELIVTMPDSMSRERQKMFMLFGAKVELTQAHLGMQGAIDRARELQKKIPGSVGISQFDNPANPLAHEITTAKEILADTDGKADVVVAGVGTGGTITGLARGLKKENPAIQIVAVEPAGSSVLSGGSPGPHMIQGIGAGFVPSILDRSLLDETVTVTDNEAFQWARRIIREEGILCGISSGAALCATDKYLRTSKAENRVAVVILPDTGERYLSVTGFAGE